MNEHPRHNVCHYCGAVGDTTTDHIVPISRGGRDISWNKVRACHPCNQGKGADWPTCECPKCLVAVERHPRAWQGEMEDRPLWIVKRSVRLRPNRDQTKCRDCGDPTMTPEDCPWCRATRETETIPV